MQQLTLRFTKSGESYTKAELALLTPDDIFEAVNAELLQLLGEDRRLERKTGRTHAQVLGKYLSTWSNTPPDGGLLVIGQEDDGSFSGLVHLSRDEINTAEGAVFHCPSAHVVTKRVAVQLPSGADDFVILMRVRYNTTTVVRDLKGGAYGRISDKLVKLDDVQVKELSIAKGEVDLEQEPVTTLVYPDDFNLQHIRQFTDAVVRFKKLTVGHTDDEILMHSRLGKVRDGKFTPNVACALLFAKDPLLVFPGCKIRFLRFDGETEGTGASYNVVKDVPIEGTIPAIIEEAAKVLSNQLREFSTLGEDGRFYTIPEYPPSAWYEAIVNACVHRSYVLKNMVTFVKMFDDRLVIESPGGFPPNVTPETIYDTSSPRNPHLMYALFFTGFVKGHGEGTKRMRDLMSAANLPKPEFVQKEVSSGYNQVRVTLRNNLKLRKLWIDSELGGLIAPEVLRDLTDEERRILNYVTEHGSINVTQSQALFHGKGSRRRWHAYKKVLTGMVAKGLLAHHHSPVVKLDSRACYKLPQPKEGNGDKKA